jgi:hypothetical protein
MKKKILKNKKNVSPKNNDVIDQVTNLRETICGKIKEKENIIAKEREELNKLKQALSAFVQVKDKLSGSESVVKSKSTRIIGLAQSILQAVKCTDKIYTPTQMAKEIEHIIRAKGWSYNNYTSYKASVCSTLARLAKQGKIGQTPNTESGKGFKYYRIEEKKTSLTQVL